MEIITLFVAVANMLVFLIIKLENGRFG